MKPDLDAIRERADKATQGPWRAGRMDTVSSHGDRKYFKNVYCDAINPKYHLGLPLPEEIASAYDANGVDCRENADFIANARQDIPALLAHIDKLTDFAMKAYQQFIRQNQHHVQNDCDCKMCQEFKELGLFLN